MGKNLSKEKREKEEREKEERERELQREREIEENERLYEEELQREYQKKVKEYKDFISKYESYDEAENNVELNEPFIIKGSIANGIPPDARKKDFNLIGIDDHFEFVEKRRYNLTKPNHYGGSTTIIYVFKPIKKGKGRILFTRRFYSFTIVWLIKYLVFFSFIFDNFK